MINLGMQNISKAYLGATEVPKLYFGSELVYTSEAPLDLAEPLTFEILSGSGEIRWTAGTSNYGKLEEVYYQKINEWGDIEEDGSIDKYGSLNVNEGETVRFYGNYQIGPGATIADSRSCGRFGIDQGVSFNVKGNIMSLLKYGWDDDEQVPVPTYSGMTDFVLDPDDPDYSIPIRGVFSYLFSSCTGLIDASQLILPATSLTFNCYYGMFQGCTSLTTAPELPATRGSGVYTFMFDGCTNLNYVKCLLTTNLSQGNWLRGVSATGTFVKHPDATWPRNVHGIPSGWTVVDA